MKAFLIVAWGTVGLATAGSCGGTQIEPRKSHNRLQLAKDYLAKQDLVAAEGEADKALDFDPANAEAHNVLGTVDFLRALNNFRLLEVEDCVTGVDAEGLREEMEANLTAADKHYADALGLDGGFAEARANRGSVALLREDYAGALRFFEEALRTPQRAGHIGLLRANVGWAHFHTGDMAKAAMSLRQALQFNPGMCVANYRLGRVYFAREEWNKALEQFRLVAGEKDCRMQEAHLYLVKTYRRLSEDDAVSAAVEACVTLAPASCIAAECRTEM